MWKSLTFMICQNKLQFFFFIVLVFVILTDFFYVSKSEWKSNINIYLNLLLNFDTFILTRNYSDDRYLLAQILNRKFKLFLKRTKFRIQKITFPQEFSSSSNIDLEYNTKQNIKIKFVNTASIKCGTIFTL